MRLEGEAPSKQWFCFDRGAQLIRKIPGVVVTVLSGLNPCICHAGIKTLLKGVHDRCGAHFYDRHFLCH